MPMFLLLVPKILPIIKQLFCVSASLPGRDSAWIQETWKNSKSASTQACQAVSLARKAELQLG
jgi:hypothetical protein